MALPLEGVRVLEIAEHAFGPGACQLLGDMGAEIIKIEDPEGGDPLRNIHPMLGMPASRTNINFDYHNRNKKSLALDLAQESGRQVVYELAAKSDVLVVCLHSGEVGRFEMDYATLSRVNPRLIYVQGTCFGTKGPLGERPGLDVLAIARSGIQDALREPDQAPPRFFPFWLDHVGSINLAYAVMLALYHRGRTGEGQEVQVSLLGSAVFDASSPVHIVLSTGAEFPRTSRKESGNPLGGAYKCKDGRWLYFSMAQSDRYWPRWCTALGVEHLIADPRYDSSQKRGTRPGELIALFDEVFAARTRDEWMERLSQFDFLWAPINSFYEAAHDPQMYANGYIVEVNHPEVGPIKMVGSAQHLSKCPARIESMAPQLGQHTEEILSDILGYGRDQIQRLKQGRVIP